jgi:tryptophan synthase alpha chain
MINPIDALFYERDATRLMAHVVAGDPDLDSSLNLAERMAQSGADLIEIQIPFSDPLADGPTIMASNQIALDNGVRPEDCFAMIRRLRERVSVPLLVMTYGNIPYRRGWKRFAGECAGAGASGVIIPDLPWDEPLPGLSDALRSRGIHFIHLVSPGMSDDRLKTVLGLASGFLYLTLRVGTTGAVSGIEPQGLEFLRKVKSLTRLPVAAGFGVSAPDQVKRLKGRVDAVIIGSHLINLRREQGVEAVESFLRLCKSSVRGDNA